MSKKREGTEIRRQLPTKKTKANDDSIDDKPFILESMGMVCKIGDTRFISNSPLYMVELDDYTLIVTNDKCIDLLRQYVPRSLRNELETRWHYALHIPQMQMSVSKKLLRDRVLGGEILAYRHTEGNIEGNMCCYYGFIPTIVDTEDAVTNYTSLQTLRDIPNALAFKSMGTTHRKPRITTKAIWPRKLYIHLKQMGQCDCSDDCYRFQVMVRNSKDVHMFCLKNMPWGSIYVMMGDTDITELDAVKDLRVCSVCAQCFDCSKSATFCRRHRVCKHKKSVLFELNNTTMVSDSKIKMCKKLRK